MILRILHFKISQFNQYPRNDSEKLSFTFVNVYFLRN